MGSLAGNLESQPRGRLNTSFTFVPTISNNTPQKKEMQHKFLPVQKKIYAAATPPARNGQLKPNCSTIHVPISPFDGGQDHDVQSTWSSFSIVDLHRDSFSPVTHRRAS
jgi:hypothetical protein